MFWIDDQRGFKKTYEDLLDDISKKEKLSKYIKFENPYYTFVAWIKNVLNRKDSVFLDVDFSETELFNMGLTKEILENEEYVSDIDKHDSIGEMLEKFIKYAEDSCLEIYTSGTTGRPKSVKQSYSNLTRNVKTGVGYVNNIWGFTYNATHFAGVQVFLQGFLNLNTIIYLFDSSENDIKDSITNNRITHISCTPTFFKRLLIGNERVLDSVKQLTFGGEKFDSSLTIKLTAYFPNARVSNIYASTEAGSLFSSDGENFKIPLKIKDLVKINESNELLIHKSLIGDFGTENREWFNTGDTVKYVDKDKFVFLSRTKDFINVGGYKVNPHEVEKVISSIEEVKEVIVYGRKNSFTGNIVACDIVPAKDIANLAELKKKVLTVTGANLQEWKVPRIIKFVEELSRTRSGKIKRI